MANKYDANQMKTCADNINSQLEKFRKARQAVDDLVDLLDDKSWEDDTNRRFAQKYNSSAKQTLGELDKLMDDASKLMYQCAKRFANAIDNGNTYLSE